MLPSTEHEASLLLRLGSVTDRSDCPMLGVGGFDRYRLESTMPPTLANDGHGYYLGI